jgi:hypothetical protein
MGKRNATVTFTKARTEDGAGMMICTICTYDCQDILCTSIMLGTGRQRESCKYRIADNGTTVPLQRVLVNA